MIILTKSQQLPKNLDLILNKNKTIKNICELQKFLEFQNNFSNPKEVWYRGWIQTIFLLFLGIKPETFKVDKQFWCRFKSLKSFDPWSQLMSWIIFQSLSTPVSAMSKIAQLRSIHQSQNSDSVSLLTWWLAVYTTVSKYLHSSIHLVKWDNLIIKTSNF